MKKRISTIIAVVLTLALLASSFALLGVFADEPTTETITIGGTDYEIYTDKKFAAIDSIDAAVDGLTPADNTAGYGTGPDISFDDQAWEFKSTGLWSSEFKAPKYVTTQTNYNQVCFYTSEPVFARKSIVSFENNLYVNAAHGWQSEKDQQIKPIYMNFKATEDGSVVLYDKNGAVSAPGRNTTPFWAWISEGKGQWATFSIYKNSTLLWPLNGEDNKIELGGESITFPDLGAIKVKKGDVISIEVSAFGDRNGLIMNPVVAYAKVEETDGKVDTVDVTVGENTYVVEKNANFDAYAALTKLTNGMADDTEVVFNSKWTMDYQFTADKGFGKDPWGTAVTFKYGIPYNAASGSTTDLRGIHVNSYLVKNTWSNCFFTGSVTYIPTGEMIYVSPSTSCLNAEGVANAATAMKLTFTASKAGNVVVYDKTGKFDGNVAISPYWANESDAATVKIEIYKNDTKIWPTDVDQIVSKNNKQIVFPDLGEITVAKGDQISFVFYGNPEKPDTRAGVLCNPAVGYIYDESNVEEVDPNREELVVGTSSYSILTNTKSDLFKGFTAITEGLADKSEVKFTNNWSYAYRYTNDVDFGKSPWKQDLKYVTGIPYYSISNKGTGSVTYKGIYPDSTLSLNSWHNCMFLSSATLIPEMEALYISPACESLKDNKIAEEVWGPALKITYTSDKTGKAVLYDTTGVFSGDVAKAPYWANENANAKTKIEIYKNGKKIWPTDGDVIITNTNKRVTFPDLGELDLKIGDKIDFLFYGNPESPSTRTGVICNPAVAFTEVTATGNAPQTDANYGSQVMLLVSVIAVLGAVVIAATVIAKKRAHN